jgi:hypothetical protein
MNKTANESKSLLSIPAIRIYVDKLADKLGMPVDPGIKELVVALQANNLETSGSCEGHIRENGDISIPWVAIEISGPEGWRDSETLQQQWREENLRLRILLEAALGGFYRNRKSDYRLGIRPRGIYGATRLEPAVGKKEVTAANLSEYQHELNDFAEFLLKRVGGEH